MVRVSLRIRMRPHKRDEALNAIDALAERMRHAPGCSRCALLTEVEDHNSVALESEWTDMKSAEAFFDSRELQILRGIRILLRDEPLIVLDDVRERVTRMIGRS